MAEAVDNLLNFWKTHNIGLSTNGLFNSSVNYSYPSIDNVFTTSIINEIPVVESKSVFGQSTPTPAQTSNSGDIVNYRKKVSQQNQQLELNFGNSEITTNPTPNKKAQVNATSAKKVSQQNQQLELNFGNSEVTTNPTPSSNVEVEKAEKPLKSKTKSTKKGKQSKFFKGKKGRFGAILAGIALGGAAIAYVVNKAGDKVDKAKDVKAEKPVENTTQIEEASEIVEPIQVAPDNAPDQEEIVPDVVTVKSGDTVWDLCEQKLKEWGNENPTAKQIRELVDKVIADERNNLDWEHDNYAVIIKPEQGIRICKPEE